MIKIPDASGIIIKNIYNKKICFRFRNKSKAYFYGNFFFKF